MGITISGGDRVYVSDSFAQRLQVLGLDGTFLFKFGMSGVGEREFNRPCHLAALGRELGRFT